MNPFNPENALYLIQTQGYFVMFLLMVIEGPIITYLAAFASSLGIFNIYLVFLLAVLGNSIPDTILFFIGKKSRVQKIERIIEYFGLTKSRIKNIEKSLKEHRKKSIVLIKLIPGLAVPGILLAGFMKVPFKKFFMISFLFDIIAAIIFTFAGFYSGVAIGNFLKYFKLEKYILWALILAGIIIYFLLKWVYKKIGKRNKEI